MTFELREHTADVAVSATADSMAGVFAELAEGLAATMSDRRPATGERYQVAVTAESPEALLFDYLDELIYQRDVHDVLPIEHAVGIENDDHGWCLEGSFRGVPLRGLGGREIKAVTYSEMRLEETADDWQAYVVFDV